MVSQRSMRRIFGSPTFLLGPAIALFLASGCSRGEGERCQVNSDCASGLTCPAGSTGNGICKPANGSTLGTDAAAADDTAPISGPEVEPTVDAESTTLPDATVAIDTIDTEAGAKAGAEAGAIDTM